MCHLYDGEAWKHFDKMYPEFATKPINIKLALCCDDFSLFNNSTTPYSCWLIIVKTTPFMCLTLIIPMSYSPKDKIDVYL